MASPRSRRQHLLQRRNSSPLAKQWRGERRSRVAEHAAVVLTPCLDDRIFEGAYTFEFDPDHVSGLQKDFTEPTNPNGVPVAMMSPTRNVACAEINSINCQVSKTIRPVSAFCMTWSLSMVLMCSLCTS